MSNKKGFTLVEMIVVILIIAVLAAVAVPMFSKYVDDAKRAAAQEGADALYKQFNLVMLRTQQDQERDDILLCLNDSRYNATIIYQGPTDNSITNPKGYHDAAKNALRRLAGGDRIIPFGYRLYATPQGTNSYRIDRIEIFYQEPTNAQILAATPDFIL